MESLKTSIDSSTLQEITIESLSYGTAAIAHDANGKTLFVEGGAPGDVVRAKITADHGRFATASLTEVVRAGDAREQNPFCTQVCGGCPWRHVTYEAQVSAKRANVVNALARIGRLGLDTAERLTAPCVPSPRATGYRNKIELNAHFSGKRLELGFCAEGTHDMAQPDSCPLALPALQDTLKSLRGALRYLCGTENYGLFRVGVRGALHTSDLEVALWTTPGAFPRGQAAKTITSALPRVTSIVRVMATPGKERAIKGVEQLSGKGYWEERLVGAKFATSAPSFFQVNTQQAEELIRQVLDALGNVSGLYVADLYSGGGTFSIPLAQAGACVAAVESAGTSVRDLRRNAARNGVEGAIDIIGGDAARELPGLGKIDALVVDPPRAGLAAGVVDSIAAASPAKVVYVSCDPGTLARDVALFREHGYEPTRVTPVDLFPQTFHVETVVLLCKK